MKKVRFLAALLVITALLGSCGSEPEGSRKSEGGQSGQATAGAGELSEWELEHGIGPVKSEIKLGPLDAALARQGGQIFETKCTACHRLDERYVGPPLGEVTQRRTPEFIMNMILNPDEMVKKHPEGQKLLATYLAPMTFQNVTREDARAILEFFRSVVEDSSGK